MQDENIQIQFISIYCQSAMHVDEAERMSAHDLEASLHRCDVFLIFYII